jgi:hypothetical protein
LKSEGGFTAIHSSAVVHQFSHGGILPHKYYESMRE